MTWKENHRALWDYVRDHNIQAFLEIGIGSGRNAFEILSNMTEQCQYYGFDLFFPGTFEDRKKWIRKLADYTVLLVHGDSKETLPKFVEWLPPIDVIFINGAHTYENTKSDWKCSKELVRKDGVIFFHNVGNNDVGKVVNEIDTEKYKVKISGDEIPTARVEPTGGDKR